ncbi:FAD-dependent oxidoreductase [Streptomyces sp. NPDC004609]|uniref:FAD-dependent oxidoreductase n=1 Tax=Streptomyces sp. NPDC004609 TaxID=3364704 RepID=UPI0036B09616
MTTDDGHHLPYDRLVYALGSRTGDIVGEHVYSAESADALRKRLQDRPGSLAVVGGGLPGTEMAADVAETHPDGEVRLLAAGLVAGGHSPCGRAHVRRVLEARGVHVEEGAQVTNADAMDADAVVWAASMVPHTDLASAAGLALDPATGRIAVDASLRSVTHPGIHAVADASAAHTPKAGRLRMAAPRPCRPDCTRRPRSSTSPGGGPGTRAEAADIRLSRPVRESGAP